MVTAGSITAPLYRPLVSDCWRDEELHIAPSWPHQPQYALRGELNAIEIEEAGPLCHDHEKALKR